jgi:hypothetical protein
LAVSIAHQGENGPMITHILAAVFFLASTFFIWRSFHKMRIGAIKPEPANTRVDSMAAE